MEESLEYKQKICLIGEGAVGKTSLIRKFVFDDFDDKYMTTLGTKITKRVVQIRSPEDDESLSVILLVWDIMGQPGFRQLLKETYFHGASGLMAICDVTRKDSLYALSEWIKISQESVGEVPAVFLGNKCDLVDEQEVSLEDIKTFASSDNEEFTFLSSAKTGENVESAFRTLSESILKNRVA